MSTKQVGPIQFQGKLGTIVGRATRKGTMSLSMAPTKYTDPQTEKQVRARTRFLAVQPFPGSVPREAFAGLARSAQSGKMSLKNLAFKANMKAQKGQWTETPEGEGTITQEMDKACLVFSMGNTQLQVSKLDVTTPNTIKFTATFPQDVPTVEDSKVIYHAIVYNNDYAIFKHVVQEDETTFTITTPEAWNGMKVWVYVYAQYFDSEATDFDYSALSPIAATARFLAENAKLAATKTAFVGNATIG